MLLRGLSPLVATLSTPLTAPVIVGIDEVAWTPIHYPHAIWDDDAGCWITDVEVAETGYTAFAGTRHQVAARLVVRRIRREPPPGLDELLPAWGNHALRTDTALSTIDADLTHCAHTLIEQVFADLIDASAGAPAGRFATNGPWLLCAGSNGESCRFAPAETRPSGTPSASVAVKRFSPCLRRSTGDGPALSPPQGTLVMHPSTDTPSSSRR